MPQKMPRRMPGNLGPPPCPVSLLKKPQCSENRLSCHRALAYALGPQLSLSCPGSPIHLPLHSRAPNRGVFPLVTAEHLLWEVFFQLGGYPQVGVGVGELHQPWGMVQALGQEIPSSSLRVRDTSLPGPHHPHIDTPKQLQFLTKP